MDNRALNFKRDFTAPKMCWIHTFDKNKTTENDNIYRFYVLHWSLNYWLKFLN